MGLFGGDISLADAFRFAKKIEFTPDCWLWTGSIKDGYGQFRVGSVSIGSHRIAYAIHKGCFPADQHVLHTCDNPRCCNPAHLFLGDHALNMADMTLKRRNESPRPGNGRRKVAESEHPKICMLYTAGVSISEIARRYGLTTTGIRHILKKREIH